MAECLGKWLNADRHGPCIRVQGRRRRREEKGKKTKETNNADKTDNIVAGGRRWILPEWRRPWYHRFWNRKCYQLKKASPDHIRRGVQRSVPLRGKRFSAPARIPLSVTDNGHSTSETGDHKTSCTTLNNFSTANTLLPRSCFTPTPRGY